MAKHRRQNTTARSVAAAAAAVASASLLAPATANAAEVRVPNTNLSAEIPGIENIPGIANIPGIDAWIPSLAGQAGGGDIASAIAAVKAIPGVSSVPGFDAFISDVEARYAPVDEPYSAPAPAAAVEPASAPAPAVQMSSGQRLVDIARSKIGSPYMYGGSGPDAFDCSGFTSWVHAQVGKAIPRTSQAQAAAGQPVSRENIQPGDVVAYYSGASHVGIYAGNGMIIDALNSGTPVAEHPIDMMPIHSIVRF